MGTTSQKLEYLNGTKNSLKSAINNLGGAIDSNTTFRAYASQLDTIYNNLPKVSDTGTNVSLSPTLKGRLGIVPKGNTLQDGEPTPETPVEIQSATGTQKVVVSGKNLWNFELVQKGFNTVTGGLSSNSTRVSTEQYILLKSGSYTINSNKQVVVYVYDENKEYKQDESIITWQATPYTFTLTDLRNVRFGFRNSDNSVIVPADVEDIQLEKGNTATSYQPYQEPQEVDIELGNIELNKIGDYEDYIGGTSDNWVLYKNIGKVVLNGSENWQVNSSWNYTNTNLFITGQIRTAEEVKTNYFKYYKSAYSNDINGEVGQVWSDYLAFRINNTIASDVNGFKTWLSSHNTELLYVLAETQQTPITDTNLVSQLNELYYLQSYNDTTNIDVTGNLPMRITASAIKGV